MKATLKKVTHVNVRARILILKRIQNETLIPPPPKKHFT